MRLEPDLFRHVVKGFAVAVALSALFGFLFTTLDQIPVHEIENEYDRGFGVGRQRGYVAEHSKGILAGAERASEDLLELVDSGNFDEAYRMAYNYAWNTAISYALDRAQPRKLTALAAFDEWEALKR